VLPAVFALGPALAEAELAGASSWAAIVACFGIGTVTGNLIALRLRPRRPVLVAAVALVGACTQAAIIGSGLGTAGIALLMVLSGIAVSLFFTLWDTSIQEQIPPHAVSRVSSYDFTVSLGLMPIGMALAGPIAGEFGLHTTLLLMSAAGGIVALAWLAVPDVRRVRRVEPEPPAAPAEDLDSALEPEPGIAATGGDGLRFQRRRSAVEER
jgi:MFS family permease